MPIALTSLDIVVFLASIALVMGVGLWAGRREKDAEGYFLAGRSIPWWGVAGSVFGTNVSAEHLVGMLGLGYSIGFAQAHFEYGAIAGLMMLCFVFLPLYRRMGVYTLSEYLGRRYDERSRVMFSLISIVTIVFVRMALAFYIGARALGYLLKGTPLETGYTTGIVILAVITSAYTIWGGLKAVIWTDVVQSILLLAAGVFVAVLVFSTPEIGGFGGLLALDAALPEAEQKFHLYLPTDHPQLPWTGVFSGLLLMHFFYWGTNQFIAQRALAARSDFDARMGLVTAGFLKLLIPFVSISAGIAAGHLFQQRLVTGELAALPQPDDAFPLLVRLVVPAGYGLMGLITAGLIGAILSTIDSMMNSGATLFTFDFYKRYWNREAAERELILAGRVAILVSVVLAALVAGIIYTENEADNFFLKVPAQTGHLVPGVLIAFLFGVLWRGGTATAAFAAILAAPFFSFGLEWGYNAWLAASLPGAETVRPWLGSQLNFLHRTALTSLFAGAVLLLGSRLDPNGRDPDAERYTWWENRCRASKQGEREFWRSERPWALLLGGLTVAMLIYFA